MSTAIATKLVAAMGEIDAVTKEGRNELQKYKYVRAADVANEVRKVLVKHKIAFTYSTGNHERWTVDRIDRQTGNVIGQMNYSNLEVHFTFTDADSGESITLNGIGCGQDTGEKAVYKAMTGALKYALRMNFIIPDESDPENEKEEVLAEVERQKKNPAKDIAVVPSLLTRQLEASLTPEERAAAMRAEMAEKQGIFSIEGGVLHCKIIGIEKLKKKSGDEYLSLTLNQRHPNGSNKASVWDTKLWEAADNCLDKECKLKISVKGIYITVEDVVWIQGVGGPITNDDLPSEMFK